MSLLKTREAEEGQASPVSRGLISPQEISPLAKVRQPLTLIMKGLRAGVPLGLGMEGESGEANGMFKLCPTPGKEKPFLQRL